MKYNPQIQKLQTDDGYDFENDDQIKPTRGGPRPNMGGFDFEF